MSEKLILVDLDITIGGDDVTVFVENYKAQVVPGMRIIWNVVMKWASSDIMPVGEIHIEIPGFTNVTKDTPTNLFEDYSPAVVTMEKVAGKDEYTALFGSPVVAPNSPLPTPPFSWVWEYSFAIWDSNPALENRHVKIDPLVVISG